MREEKRAKFSKTMEKGNTLGISVWYQLDHVPDTVPTTILRKPGPAASLCRQLMCVSHSEEQLMHCPEPELTEN